MFGLQGVGADCRAIELTVSLEFITKCALRDAQDRDRGAAVALDLLENAQDVFTLDIANIARFLRFGSVRQHRFCRHRHRLGYRCRDRCAGCRQFEVACLDQAGVGQQQAALDGVFELAHIARPAVAKQCGLGGR